ncbi:unnamed protein product [Toxocara canis]|uniref:MYND-type domain-containing protein n=1 Tax=Toxocara canis TaxID=6265 RepID=A0A183UCE2_TOXCA|nr:unnamed protein product [Toxocara canis]
MIDAEDVQYSMWKDGLLVERPLGWALAPEYLPEYCTYCLEPRLTTKLDKCSACRSIYYCGRTCQKADWPMHKMECRFCKASGSAGDESYRLLLRIVKKLEMGEDSATAGSRSFDDLMDHRSELTKLYQDWRIGFDEWIGSAPNVVQMADDLIQSIICKIFVNSFALTSVFGRTVGIALCVQLSALDHSCKPTARIAFRGNECRMVPTQSCSTAAPLTHSYIDELLPREERRKQLRERYKFDCQCEGCLDEARNAEMVAFACEMCKGPTEMGANCLHCKMKMSTDRLDVCKIANDLAEASLNVCFKTTDKLTLCTKSLEVVDDVFCAFNIKKLALLRGAYEACVALSRFTEANFYGSQVLEILLHYGHPDDIAIIHLKFNLAKIYLKDGQKDFCGMLLIWLLFVTARCTCT